MIGLMGRYLDGSHPALPPVVRLPWRTFSSVSDREPDDSCTDIRRERFVWPYSRIRFLSESTSFLKAARSALGMGIRPLSAR